MATDHNKNPEQPSQETDVSIGREGRHKDRLFSRGKAKWAACASAATILGLGAAAGAISGGVTPFRASTEPLAAVRSSRDAASGTVQHLHSLVGSRARFELHVEPRSIVTTATGASRLEIGARIENHFDNEAAFQLAYHLVNARGNAVTDPVTEPVRLAAPSSPVEWPVISPADLSDGHYKFRVIAVGTDGSEDTVLETQIAFRMEGGQITPLNDNEWYEVPEVNQAIDG